VIVVVSSYIVLLPSSDDQSTYQHTLPFPMELDYQDQTKTTCDGALKQN
jgi:hypothetical protein